MTRIPHVPLAQLPTPLEPLPRLSAELGGPRIWVKRDDQTGLAMGGNKVRKLEYLLAEARALGADIVLTTGATQSNHCRQTAAAAARMGLDCESSTDSPTGATTTGTAAICNSTGCSALRCSTSSRAPT